MSDAILRPWRAGDVDGLLPAFADPTIARMLGVDPGNRAEIDAWLERRLAADIAVERSLAIEVDGVARGEVSLSRFTRHRTCWLAYWIAPEQRGRGIVTRAAATMIGWAFSEGGLARIELGHRTDNPESAAVAMRLRFVFEGTQRQRLEYGDTRYDVATYGLLASDPRPDVAPLEVTA